MTPADGTPWTLVESMSVRPYAVAGGRTHTPHSPSLRLDTQVEPGTGQPPGHLAPEARQIVMLCRTRRRSIAELSGTVRQPVPVVQVLVSDLLDAHALELAPTTFDNSPEVLRDALDALRRKWPDARTAC